MDSLYARETAIGSDEYVHCALLEQRLLQPGPGRDAQRACCQVGPPLNHAIIASLTCCSCSCRGYSGGFGSPLMLKDLGLALAAAKVTAQL